MTFNMPKKPLPIELLKHLYSAEALQEIADHAGQFEDEKNYKAIERTRAEHWPAADTGRDPKRKT
jgi:hypothetical protein